MLSKELSSKVGAPLHIMQHTIKIIRIKPFNEYLELAS
jgi:hypothetical protein